MRNKCGVLSVPKLVVTERQPNDNFLETWRSRTPNQRQLLKEDFREFLPLFSFKTTHF